ncbi:MAG: UDP-N-acetylglucosamine 2-epimerase [Candidatus Omnitrophota bacterium]|jgi:GDP/UDP-N,N'-diacetylbacillosamine 2-epimerase (hydrolysing)
MKRKICFITSSRADFGLLSPLIELVKKDSYLKCQLIATGAHLSSEFGLTYREIEKNKFYIDKRISILSNSDTPVGIAKSMGLALAGFAEAYTELSPDIIVVLGDRYELLSAVAAALVSNIPVAHIAGGEVTEGACDDSIRHSITKMSQLHFTISETYRRRVIQLGEEPGRVFNVGALGIDNIKRLKLLSKKEVEKTLGFKFNKRNLLVTFHPVTLEKNASEKQFRNLLGVLGGLPQTNIIFTKANADTGGRAINKAIEDFVAKNSNRSSLFPSLGNLKYLSTMQFVDAVVGNSSSGIVEAPSFKIGVINIGDRQKGRIMAKNIINCEPAREYILRAFEKLYSKKFQKNLKNTASPYGNGNAAGRIKDILKTYKIEGILKKHFHDIKI